MFPSAAASAASQADRPEDWQVMVAENGVQYYFNSRTKKVVWQKPDCLKNEKEKVTTTPAASDWTEHVTGDGRVFYFNAVLKKSVWVKPPELMTQAEKEQQEGKGPISLAINISSQIDEGDDDADEEEEETDPKKKEIKLEEAKRIFVALLKEKGIGPEMKWKQIHELLKKEERYKVLPKMSDKKKAANAYFAEIKKNERTQARTKLEQARQDYRQMLVEFKNLTSESKYAQVAQYFYMDPRWKAIDIKDRENLYQDYLDELFEKENDEFKAHRKSLVNKMKEHFSDVPFINSKTKWTEACESLKYHAVWQELHDVDKIEAFSEFILSKTKEEEQAKRAQQLKNERKNREAFRELLREKISNDEITFKTKWRSFVKRNKDNPKLLNMLTQGGSHARDIYHDIRNILLEKNKQIKDDFKNVLKAHLSELSPNMDSIRFKKILLKHDEFASFESRETNSFEHYADYLFSKYKKRVAKAKKKYAKALGKECPNLTKDSTFQSVNAQIDANPHNQAYFACLSDHDKQDILRSLQDRLRNGESMADIFPPEKKKRGKDEEGKGNSKIVEEDKAKDQAKIAETPTSAANNGAEADKNAVADKDSQLRKRKTRKGSRQEVKK